MCTENQIRQYWWESPPRTGREMIVPSQTFIHRRNLGDFRPKGAGNRQKFSQANEVLRRETGYHTRPLGADVAAAARIPFPAHRHSVVAAHWPVAAERDNEKHLGP